MTEPKVGDVVAYPSDAYIRGVDPRRPAEADRGEPMSAALRVALATAICSTFDLDNHDHDAFMQPDHCPAGLADADQMLGYVRAALIDEAAEPREEGRPDALRSEVLAQGGSNPCPRHAAQGFTYTVLGCPGCYPALAAAQPKPTEAAEPEPALDDRALVRDLHEALEVAADIIDANVAEDSCRHGNYVLDCDGGDDDGCTDRARRERIVGVLGVARARLRESRP